MTLSQPTHTLQQQYEGTRLSVAAYGAADLKALLASNPSTHALNAGTHSVLIKQGFSVEQANDFVKTYTPVAALDQDGAGAVLFKVNGTDQIATAVRGTDRKENLLNDLFLADGSILQNQLPIHQTVLVANFVLQETTPAGEVVPQLAVEGGSSNAADLLRSSNDSLSFGLVLASPVAQAVNIEGKAEGVSLPKLVVSGTTLGTGRAVGLCVDAAGHSEGSPEVTVMGSAIAQCARITTVNGPGVSLAQMQHVADEFTHLAGLPRQDLSSQNQLNSQLNVGTTGLSAIDGFNGGLPGTNTTLEIPTLLGGLIGSHSSIVAMNAAEAAYREAGGLTQPHGNLSADYNFPNSAGAGRGVVHPELVNPSNSNHFNASQALPNAPQVAGGAPGYVVQAGDTVGGIAAKLGLSAQAYGEYLKTVYGEDADLNSIVAGRELPVPSDAPHAGRSPGESAGEVKPSNATAKADNDGVAGASNGEAEAAQYRAQQQSLAQNSAQGQADAADPWVEAFTHADAIAADIKTQYPHSVRVAQAGEHSGAGFEAPTNPATHTIPTTNDHWSAAQLQAMQEGLSGTGLEVSGLGAYRQSDGSYLLTNTDGDVVGTVSEGPNHTAVLRTLDGQEVVTDALGQRWSEQELAQAQQATAALSLMNSMMGLYHGLRNDNALQTISGGVQLVNDKENPSTCKQRSRRRRTKPFEYLQYQ